MKSPVSLLNLALMLPAFPETNPLLYISFET